VKDGVPRILGLKSGNLALGFYREAMHPDEHTVGQKSGVCDSDSVHQIFGSKKVSLYMTLTSCLVAVGS
jgi:hypothetical protein